MQEQYTINSSMLENFRITWAIFDPKGTGFISKAMLIPFLKMIGKPLGLDHNESNAESSAFIDLINLSLYNEMSEYQYLDVILRLSRKILEENEIKTLMALHPNEADAKPFAEQIKKELDAIDDNDENIHQVKEMKKREKIIKKK